MIAVLFVLLVLATFSIGIESLGATTNSTSTMQTKIQHLIFIIQENHSFDNYFGTYPGVNGLSNASACCPTSFNSISSAEPKLVKPFHLNVAEPVYIVGDELPPGEMYPNDALNISNSSSDGNVLPFGLPSE